LIGKLRELGRAIAGRFSRRAHPRDPALIQWFGGGTASASGAVVTEDTAMNHTAVYACVRILAETVASLPLSVYQRKEPRGKELARRHPLHRVLHDEPNPWMSAFTFRETMMGHLVLRGNAYAEKVFDGSGQVVELWPLPPDRVRPVVADDELYYDVQSDGQKRLPAQRVLHLKAFGGDGLTGYSPIRMAREAIGLAMACEESGARLFGNGSRPGGILTHPGQLGDKARANLKSGWEAAQGGLSNMHRLAILEEGMKWEQTGIAPEDAQYLETRRFQLAEIARWFRVPLHLLQDLEHASYATVEQQGIDFTVHSIRPWCVRLEQEYARQLFLPRDRSDYFAEHKIDGLLRGETAARYSAYAVGRQWGWLSIDDVRDLENMNPLPEDRGGDYMQPMNMIAIPPGGLAALEPEDTEDAPKPASDV